MSNNNKSVQKFEAQMLTISNGNNCPKLVWMCTECITINMVSGFDNIESYRMCEYENSNKNP